MSDETRVTDENHEGCDHPWDDHLLMTADPRVGGIIKCPVEGCKCQGTWSPAGRLADELNKRNN